MLSPLPSEHSTRALQSTLKKPKDVVSASKSPPPPPCPYVRWVKGVWG